MREFFLTNEKNEIFDLMGKETDFFHSPEGLGFTKTIGTTKLNTIDFLVESINDFDEITGEIVFKGYRDYQAFISFIFSAREIRFNYIPSLKIGSYYVQVLVRHVGKGDISPETSRLHCPVNFKRLSMWTRESMGVIFEQDEFLVTDTYPYTYPIQYAPSETHSRFLPVVINNNGHMPAPIKITIFGPSVDPSWEIGDQKGGLNMTLLNDQTLTVDSREDRYCITSGEIPLDNFKKHELQNYIFAPIGESTLLIGNVTKVEVTLFEQFTTV